MQLPGWDVYCKNTTGQNALRFDLGDVTVWYSYKTIVAFRDSFGKRYVRQNDWGPTTGKHLNAIDGGDKKARIPGDEFERKLRTCLRYPPVACDA